MPSTSSRKIAASRPSGCSATASTVSSSTRARQLPRRVAPRVHGRQQGLRFRTAASRTQNDLNSIGFNASWDVADNFNLGFDFHNSRAGSHPDDGITGGSQTSFSLAGKVPSTGNCARGGPTGCTNFWTQTFQFNDGLPVAARTLFPTSSAGYAGTGGNNDYSFDTSSLGSQILRINYQEQNTDIKQAAPRRQVHV